MIAPRFSQQGPLPPLPTGGKRFSVATGQADTGRRLDTVLTRLMPDLSRSAVQRLIRLGRVSRQGTPLKASLRVEPGWTIDLHIPPPQAADVLPEAIPLDVLYHDDHLIVVNKPPGLVTHPGPGNRTGTLVNAVMHICPTLSGIGGELRPGIVHRLDKGTSGVMVVAKTDRAHRRLASQFKRRQVAKTYLALVWDNVAKDRGSVSLPIGRDRGDRKKMSARTANPRQAVTDFAVRHRFGGCTLLEVFPKTGRTHQIRVHLAHINHAIIGDPVYGRRRGRPQVPPSLAAAMAAVQRPLLHAWRLAFRHPETGIMMTFTAAPPGDMAPFMPTEIRHE